MKKDKYKILTVVGARPQFVKAAIVSKWLSEEKFSERIEEVLVHTGQHYDKNLSDLFFTELNMKTPDFRLNPEASNAGNQLSDMISGLWGVTKEVNPDAFLVYGDTNSTLAAGIVAAQLDIPIVHAEAGERIFRRYQVPEEKNRVAIDHLADLCLTSTQKAKTNLAFEGMCEKRIEFIGDPMWDLFLFGKERSERISPELLKEHGLEKEKYILATVHRAENTTDERVKSLFESLSKANLPVVIPVHPRLGNLIKKLELENTKNIKLIPPQGYFEFLSLLVNCERVFTDSGGVTREAFFAEKVSLIPMRNSWWKEIVETGWAYCIPAGEEELLEEMLNKDLKGKNYPEGIFGNGKSGEVLWEKILNFMDTRELEGNWHRLGSESILPKVTESTFSYSRYENFLVDLKEKGYQFTSFTEPLENLKNNPSILLRHDIDFTLEKALEMAKVEKAQNISSTFFIMLSSVFYNVFTSESRELLKEILNLGHNLGLHFDCATYPDITNKKELKVKVALEVMALEGLTGRKVEIVSFHRPNELVLTGDPEITYPLEHTYMNKFTKEIEYCSDSRGMWKYGAPWERDSYKNNKSMHILIHPIWWESRPHAGFSILENFVLKKRKSDEIFLADNCTPYDFGWRN